MQGSDGVWALGDCAAVPYWHASAGSVASLGLYRGVAEIYGLRMRGFPAWATHRTYHAIPSAFRQAEAAVSGPGVGEPDRSADSRRARPRLARAVEAAFRAGN